ncbi:sporulation protein YqfC [Lachnospiraceae bacterium XBB1006]|nr:sporulation protein YqfC [Lachnospiraceae bacterium XBB1006]
MRERITDQLQLPTDIMLGAAILTLSDNRILKVENVQGILGCDEKQIRIMTKHFRITIYGTALMVVSYSRDEVLIKGMIDELHYTSREDGA